MKNQLVDVYLSIGSNVDSETNIRFSLAALGKQFGQIKLSSIYKSPPLNGKGQDYLNLVVSFQTDISLDELSKRLKLIEDGQGRQRHGTSIEKDNTKNNSSQKKDEVTQVTIDLDILLYSDLQGVVGNVTLPHHDILACSYVLKPLSELAPNLKYPIDKITMKKHWQRLYSQTPSGLVEVKLF